MFLYIQKLKIDKSYNVNYQALQRLTDEYKSTEHGLHFVYFYLLAKDFYFKFLERTYYFHASSNLYLLFMSLNSLKYAQYRRFYLIYSEHDYNQDY